MNLGPKHRIKLPEQHTPRWAILLIDVGICLLSLLLAFGLRFNFQIPTKGISMLTNALPFFLAIRIVSFLIGKTYAGIIRYTSTEDAVRLFLTVTAGSILFVLLNPVRYYLLESRYFLPFSVIIIDYLVTIFILISYRMAIKTFHLETRSQQKGQNEGLLIYGAGEMGIITKRTLDRDASNTYRLLAFLDDDKSKAGKTLEGSPIIHSDKLADLIERRAIAQVIVAIRNPDKQKERAIIDTCIDRQVKVMTVPPVDQWINGQLSLRQIKEVRIDDLLGRKPIRLDEKSVQRNLKGRNVLVTGAAGSIGSELVRQVLNYGPARVILLDQAESQLYELEVELRGKYPEGNFECVIGDIRNRDQMNAVIKEQRPDMVFHAAAYKHVPLMESHPREATLTNVIGTKVVADAAISHGVEEFLMISTDKAVNPTSVMGLTKRMAEIYIQSLNKESNTRFITTRFGNVLDSHGSVIPLFKKQIQEGGPVTVTHPEVTRYFMTIPESVQLVLEAAAMGAGGEVFLFDMGHSVKIIDLAKKMIRLSGFEPELEIPIKVTGLRAGEKLYEELLTDQEEHLSTHHPQIMIARMEEYHPEQIRNAIHELEEAIANQEKEDIIRALKEMIPESKSQHAYSSPTGTN